MAWPFWAPTEDDRVEAALTLAGLTAGERFVDLGCGDGRVLVRAARRGAVVAGVELDPTLATLARQALTREGLKGAVLEADFGSVEVDADVVFAFLSPASLQRLTPRLSALPPGTRIVTTGFGIPVWDADESADRCFLYRLPARPSSHQGPIGFTAAGVLAVLRAEVIGLSAIRLHHPGGPVTVRPDADLARHADTLAGADVVEPGGAVVVDLRWQPRDDGAEVRGLLQCPGIEPLVVFAHYTDGSTGFHGLSDDGLAEVERAWAAGKRLGTFVDQARRESGR